MLRFAITLLLLPGALMLQGQALLSDLPDAPGVQMFSQPLQPLPLSGIKAVPCIPVSTAVPASGNVNSSTEAASTSVPCPQPVDPYARFVDSPAITPLTVRQKGLLAVHDVIDPVNLATIGLSSAIAVGANSHSAYGPGLRGWGRDAGYGLLQDAQGEFIETFLIASLTHEDPRYHRMPQGKPMQRVWHAVRHTYVTRHDDGRAMPNYSTLLGFPLCAEVSNLYVPGIGSNAKSTAERVLIGWAGDPVDNLITEFLPDIAVHIHLRAVFVQRVLNRVATGQSAE